MRACVRWCVRAWVRERVGAWARGRACVHACTHAYIVIISIRSIRTIKNNIRVPQHQRVYNSAVKFFRSIFKKSFTCRPRPNTRADRKVTHNNFFCVGIAAGMFKFHRAIVEVFTTDTGAALAREE